jgi:hypothetical protein
MVEVFQLFRCRKQLYRGFVATGTIRDSWGALRSGSGSGLQTRSYVLPSLSGKRTLNLPLRLGVVKGRGGLTVMNIGTRPSITHGSSYCIVR